MGWSWRYTTCFTDVLGGYKLFTDSRAVLLTSLNGLTTGAYTLSDNLFSSMDEAGGNQLRLQKSQQLRSISTQLKRNSQWHSKESPMKMKRILEELRLEMMFLLWGHLRTDFFLMLCSDPYLAPPPFIHPAYSALLQIRNSIPWNPAEICFDFSVINSRGIRLEMYNKNPKWT